MDAIRVSAVQMRPELGGVEENCEKIISLASRCISDKSRIIVFPEACLTGYDCDQSKSLAIPSTEPSIVRLQSFAAENNIALSFGFIERDADSKSKLPYITQVICSKSGMFSYRKTHLGDREIGHFAAGSEIRVTLALGIRMGISLCWECNIPDIASTLRSKGCEIMLAPFASPLCGERRLESWSRFLPARAHDNGMYVIACNALRSQQDMGGGCAIYDPHGKLLDSCVSNYEDAITCKLTGYLPRNSTKSGMQNISYFDRRRPTLYS